MDKPGKLIPVPTEEAAPFWEGCKKRELRIHFCPACDRYQFPPQSFCRDCLGGDLKWVTASGRGKVLSYTIVHWSPNPAYAADAPYSLALIRLEEGPRMLTNIVGCPPAKLSIGMEVAVTFEPYGPDIVLPKFRPL
jgi:uncharacterized OB-fold protein